MSSPSTVTLLNRMMILRAFRLASPRPAATWGDLAGLDRGWPSEQADAHFEKEDRHHDPSSGEL
jgi:hypothetical protein